MSEWLYFIHPPREHFAATMTDEEQSARGELRPFRVSLMRRRAD